MGPQHKDFVYFSTCKMVSGMKQGFCLFHVLTYMVLFFFSAWQRDQGSSSGAEEEKVPAADGWVEVQETSVASPRLRHSFRRHWDKGQSGLWNLKVKIGSACGLSVFGWWLVFNIPTTDQAIRDL